MVFAPLRCPKLFRFLFACLRVVFSVRFAHLSKIKEEKQNEFLIYEKFREETV